MDKDSEAIDLLLVGGPYDGRTVRVPGHMETLKMPEMPEPPKAFSVLLDGENPFVSVNVHTYMLSCISYGLADTRWFMRHESMDSRQAGARVWALLWEAIILRAQELEGETAAVLYKRLKSLQARYDAALRAEMGLE